MPKYKVLVKSFINNAISEPGDIIGYDGKPDGRIELIEDEAKPAPKASKKAKDVEFE